MYQASRSPDTGSGAFLRYAGRRVLCISSSLDIVDREC